MTKSETARLIQVLLVAYPGSKIQADELTVNLWHKMLNDLPGDVVMAATERMIATLKFPPCIADIRGSVADSVSDVTGEISAGEAWAKVSKAISRYGYYRGGEAREWLGDAIWNAVEMLGGWSYLCTTEDGLSTLSAQFERRYKGAADQRKLMMQVPQDVRDRMSALVGQMTIPASKHDNDALPPIDFSAFKQQLMSRSEAQ